MLGLTVRWSLADAPDGVDKALASYVEDTSHRKLRCGRLPSPRLRLRIADRTNQINLEFSVDSAELRANSLYKIETLIAALERFRAGLLAEAELRAQRECC